MASVEQRPEGLTSILDTDLYKLTMQCAVRNYFPKTFVTYAFTNRTPQFLFSRQSAEWLQVQIDRLANLALSQAEHDFLKENCSFLDRYGYLEYLHKFRFRPSEQVELRFEPPEGHELAQIQLTVRGVWAEVILYEIPLLSLVSEAYFKFRDREWTYERQAEAAYDKGMRLLNGGCVFSEFGTRRRRDYHTQDLVMQGLVEASAECSKGEGRLGGTSNVHFAMKYKVPPVGTMAHEWFMGIAAATADYQTASEKALSYWLKCYGPGVLGIALTDTFGTPAFLEAFGQEILESERGMAEGWLGGRVRSYADVYTGIRQDSGDPEWFVGKMREFYKDLGITGRTIVFSDSLNLDLCLKLRETAEKEGFKASFGIGTFFTNDFLNVNTGERSKPVNIVIKLTSADGQPAIKLSDDLGKNTGDPETVQRVKERLGYVDKHWAGGDEKARW